MDLRHRIWAFVPDAASGALHCPAQIASRKVQRSASGGAANRAVEPAARPIRFHADGFRSSDEVDRRTIGVINPAVDRQLDRFAHRPRDRLWPLLWRSCAGGDKGGFSGMASLAPNGRLADVKTVYPGSIPGVASTFKIKQHDGFRTMGDAQ